VECGKIFAWGDVGLREPSIEAPLQLWAAKCNGCIPPLHGGRGVQFPRGPLC
jgi:hypothetical protein